MPKETKNIKQVKSGSLAQTTDEILNCRFCNQHKKGELVPGEGNSRAKIVFVGEAPGKEEIKTGRPFVGRAGKVLHELLAAAGLKAEEVYITSAVKYLPKTYVTPKPIDINHGRKHLDAQLAAIKPKVIVVLGNTAAVSLLGEKLPGEKPHAGKLASTKLAISKLHGTITEQDGYQYFFSYHPAAPLYSPKLRAIMIKDFKKLKQLIKDTVHASKKTKAKDQAKSKAKS